MHSTCPFAETGMGHRPGTGFINMYRGMANVHNPV